MTAYVTSVQSFEITIGNGASSNTATITSVDTTKAVVFFSGYTYDNAAGNLNNVQPRVELTNATTVTATRSGSTNGVTVRGMVVEFTSSTVASVQYGTVTIASSAASGTATISSVTTSRSAVFFLGNITNSTGTAPNSTNARLDLTNATTVTATRESTTTSTVTAGFCVVEFQAAAIQSVQQRSKALTSSTTTDTDTISSITTSNAMLVKGGTSSSTSTWAAYNYYAQITGATAVTLTRTGTQTSARTVNYTVVEFVSGVMTSVQRGNTPIASVTSADTTVTSVDTTRAVLSFGGFSTTAASATQALASAKLFNATTVRGEKGTAGLVTSTAGWELIEFTAGGDASTSVTGVAGTGSPGAVSSSGAANVTLTGSSASASAGTVTASVSNTTALTGSAATASAGSVSATGNAATAPSGIAATSAAGTTSASGAASLSLSGVSGTGAAGSLSPSGAAAASLTGAASTASAGSVTASASDAQVTLTGATASASAGGVTAQGSAPQVIGGGRGGDEPSELPPQGRYATWNRVLFNRRRYDEALDRIAEEERFEEERAALATAAEEAREILAPVFVEREAFTPAGPDPLMLRMERVEALAHARQKQRKRNAAYMLLMD